MRKAIKKYKRLPSKCVICNAIAHHGHKIDDYSYMLCTKHCLEQFDSQYNIARAHGSCWNVEKAKDWRRNYIYNKVKEVRGEIVARREKKKGL